MPEPVVELKGVTKRFGDLIAVDNLDLTLPRGGILGFLGPNGAGKTTSLRILLGLYVPDAGEVRVLGRRVGEARSRIGYLPEERGLYKRTRADEAIAYIASLKGMDRREALKRARELLDRFGLGAFARGRIEGLSKGMAQKVQLLAAVVHDPDLVILDEPFVGLDPVNQGELEDFIRALARDGKTILFSTHTMEHAERLCDRLVILVRGRKRFDGTLNEAQGQLPRRVTYFTNSWRAMRKTRRIMTHSPFRQELRRRHAGWAERDRNRTGLCRARSRPRAAGARRRLP